MIEKSFSYEYINDYLYSIIRADKARDEKVFIYCSGVSISRFVPLTAGKHGQASNPAFRGLQLTNHDVTSMVLGNKGIVKIIKGDYCSDFVPALDMCYAESLLLENISESFAQEVVGFSVMTLLKKIMKVCLPNIDLPGELPLPKELQTFIDLLSKQYGNVRSNANMKEVGILKKHYLRYDLDGQYRITCSSCLNDNVVSSDSTGHRCTNCGHNIVIERYFAVTTPIRGNRVSSAMVKDNNGPRVVCGRCGLIIYVKCEGEESVYCIDCGIQIDYSNYVT